MSKTLTFILVTCILVFASCRKGASPGGYWTFQGSTYYVAGCDSVAGSLNASNANANNQYTYGTIGVDFYKALPATAGTYTVVKFPPAAGQVAITIGIDGSSPAINYNSTGGNGMETVKVSIGSNGFVNVSGSGIQMYNASGGTDSSALTFNITQTQ
jgi:hypothetical protein